MDLPPEIRHNIYSYLLIHKGIPHLIDINCFCDLDTRMTTRSIFLTCRKVYHEAFDYYYARNTFSLSVITPQYSFMEIAAKSDILLRRLRHAQSLIVHIETSKEQRCRTHQDCGFSKNSKCPKQQQQWNAFTDLLLNAKRGQGRRMLKDLTIEDWGLEPHSGEATLEKVEQEIWAYSFLLSGVIFRVGQIKVRNGPWEEQAVME